MEWKQMVKTFDQKHYAKIARISEENNVDLGVASEMFRYNLGRLASVMGGTGWYKGLDELEAMVSDFLELETARRK